MKKLLYVVVRVIFFLLLPALFMLVGFCLVMSEITRFYEEWNKTAPYFRQ